MYMSNQINKTSIILSTFKTHNDLIYVSCQREATGELKEDCTVLSCPLMK